MKQLMIEARYKGRIDLSNLDAGSLPKNIGLVSTVQFIDFIGEIKEYLKRKGKNVFTAKGRQKYECHIIGCEVGAAEKIGQTVDAFLYIGTGKFHPLGVAFSTGKEVFCYDPVNAFMSKIGNAEAEKYSRKRKAAYLKFLEATEIGILVSLKPGQNNFSQAVKLKKRLKGKHCYFFVFDTLDFSQIENFPFIQCWVNTACSRVFDDYEKFPKPLANMGDIVGCVKK